MFRTVPLSIVRSFSLYTQQWYMSYWFADSLLASSQKNCPKHVQFYSKNNFLKLVHLVGFIVRMLFSGCRIRNLNENEGLQPEDAILLASVTQYCCRVYTISVYSEDPSFKSRASDRQS